MSIKKQVAAMGLSVLLVTGSFTGILIGAAWANTSDEQVAESNLILEERSKKMDEFNIQYQADMDVVQDFLTDEQREQLNKIVEGMSVAFSDEHFNSLKLEYSNIVKEALDARKAYEEEQARIAEEERLAAEQAAQAAWYNYSSGSQYSQPTSGLTKQSGVNYYDGRRETYYSSNVLYHYRTSEWSLDNEGFYRDSNGYYVVAASDKPQGSTFEGSKGTCVVLDSGCAAGTTDYYVGW